MEREGKKGPGPLCEEQAGRAHTRGEEGEHMHLSLTFIGLNRIRGLPHSLTPRYFKLIVYGIYPTSFHSPF